MGKQKGNLRNMKGKIKQVLFEKVVEKGLQKLA